MCEILRRHRTEWWNKQHRELNYFCGLCFSFFFLCVVSSCAFKTLCVPQVKQDTWIEFFFSRFFFSDFVAGSTVSWIISAIAFVSNGRIKVVSKPRKFFFCLRCCHRRRRRHSCSLWFFFLLLVFLSVLLRIHRCPFTRQSLTLAHTHSLQSCDLLAWFVYDSFGFDCDAYIRLHIRHNIFHLILVYLYASFAHSFHIFRLFQCTNGVFVFQLCRRYTGWCAIDENHFVNFIDNYAQWSAKMSTRIS